MSARLVWSDIPGWFQWRSGQEEAVAHFPNHSRFVEVGTYLGRSVCSLADVVHASGKQIAIVGVDTCRGSGVEGPRAKDYHAEAVERGGGTFAGTLHRNMIDCGCDEQVTLMICSSVSAAALFADRSLDWVHLDARHDAAHVRADIAAWLPKIAPRGWLSGDDYDEVKWPEVVATVRDVLPGARPWSAGQWRWVLP